MNNENNIFEYKGYKLSRRDLFEHISYNNAFRTLEYIKQLIDNDEESNIRNICFKGICRFLEYIHQEKDGIDIFDVTDNMAEDFIYYLSSRSSSETITFVTYRLYHMYDYFLMNSYCSANPFSKAKDLVVHARKKRGTITSNHLSDEQIETIRKEAPLNLKLYALFSLSTGCKSKHIKHLRWEHINFAHRVINLEGDTLYFSKDVSELLNEMKHNREELNLNDRGYVFRSEIKRNCSNDNPITNNIIMRWCFYLGELIGIKNLKHLDFRHTAITNFMAASGSVGMTSVIMNYPFLSSKARGFIREAKHEDILQEYKDLCKI